MVIDKWSGLGPDLRQTGRGAQDPQERRHVVRTFLAGPDLRLRRVGAARDDGIHQLDYEVARGIGGIRELLLGAGEQCCFRQLLLGAERCAVFVSFFCIRELLLYS